MQMDIMQMIAPAGPVYQAGTLSGNPVAVTAGIETLKLLNGPGVYDELEKKSRKRLYIKHKLYVFHVHIQINNIFCSYQFMLHLVIK